MRACTVRSRNASHERTTRMKRIVLRLTTGTLFLGIAMPSFGQIHQRKENQQDRIAQGVKSGSLTPHETAKIEHKEARLNKEVRHDLESGGGLSTQERAR